MGPDYDAATRALDWPVRDLLVALVIVLRRAALADYRADRAVWAALAPYSKEKLPQPELPAILRDLLRGNP